MRFKNFVCAALLGFAASLALAETVLIPPSKPIVSVEIPDSWAPETTKRGVELESPDQVATVFMEIAKSERGLDKLIDENIDWLVNDQGVKINAQSKQEKTMMVGSIQSEMMSYDAHSSEFGAANVGFIFTPIGERLLVITFWIMKKGADRQEAALGRIFESVKRLR